MLAGRDRVRARPIEITFYAIMRAVMHLEIKLCPTRCEMYDIAYRSFEQRALILSGGCNVTVLAHFSLLYFFDLVSNSEARPYN